MKLIKRNLKLFSGIVFILAIISSLVFTAIPAMAAGTATVSLSPVTQNVSNSGTFSLSLLINTDTATRGWQADVTYDSTKLTATSYTEGGFLTTWASANGDSVKDEGNGISSGKVDLVFVIVGTTNTSGPSGSGTLCTINFTAASGVNAAEAVALTDVAVSDATANGETVNTSDATVNVGTLPQADLTVTGATVTPLSSDASKYDVSFTVTNSGSLDADASVAAVSIDGTQEATVNVDAIAAGGSETVSTGTAGAFTLSGNSDAIVITADYDEAISESSYTNNSYTTSYSNYADLVVSAASTVGTGTDAAFELKFTIANNGAIAAGASQATYKVGTDAAVAVTVNALAAGASQDFDITGLTAPNLSTTIVITANSDSAVTEASTANDTASTTYTYASPNTGSTDVNGKILEVFSFTAPAAVNVWQPSNSIQLEPSTTADYNTNTTNSMSVECSENWLVTVEAQNSGKLYKWASDTDEDQDVTLHKALDLQAVSSDSGVAVASGFSGAYGAMTGSTQNFVAGTTEGLTDSYSRVVPVYFGQTVGYNDSVLASGYQYHNVLTFVCTVSY